MKQKNLKIFLSLVSTSFRQSQKPLNGSFRLSPFSTRQKYMFSFLDSFSLSLLYLIMYPFLLHYFQAFVQDGYRQVLLETDQIFCENIAISLPYSYQRIFILFHFCMSIQHLASSSLMVRLILFYLLGNCDTLSLEQDHKNSRDSGES